MAYLFDTFTNFLSGLGVAGRDKSTGFRYVKQIWTREQLEASYSSDWIARKAIAIPAMDSVREWRDWQAEQDQIELLEATEKRLLIQQKLQEALVKSRLYGGSTMLIGVDGNMAEELDPKTIKKDALKFVHVFAPHQLAPQDIIKDISSPYYGMPEFYKLNDTGGTFGDVMIHPSRMVRLIGLDPPDPMMNFGWGDPMLQVIHDAVSSAGSVMGSLATLIAEAKIDVIKIPGLTEIFSTTDGTQRMVKRMTEANVAKSVVNSILIDAEEDWQRVQVNFRGMPEILQMYLQIAAGAADIPVTRFLGMSPAGLNATGDSDLQNYYDRIKSDQELRLTPALEKLDKAIQMSSLGKIDESIFYEWGSLWQQSDAEKASIALQKAQSNMIDVNAGLIPPDALAKGRQNQLIEDGTYPGLEAALAESVIDEDMIAEHTLHQHEQKLLPAPGYDENGDPVEKEPAFSEDSDDEDAGFKGWLVKRIFDAIWREDDHPRGQPENAGQFGPGGYSGGKQGKPAPHAKGEKVHPAVRKAQKAAREGYLQHARAQYTATKEGATFTSKNEKGETVVHSKLQNRASRAKIGEFVSPSVKTNLTFKEAVRELGSPQQKKMHVVSDDINERVGLKAVKDVSVLGAWADGAENSVMTTAQGSYDEIKLAAVMKGHIFDQKQVLVFKQEDGGKSVLAHFDAEGDLAAIHRNLLKDGLAFHTLIPKEGGGATVYVGDLDGESFDKINTAAERYGNDNEIHYEKGHGEFVPPETEPADGTERQQRDRSREVYESVIAESQVPGAKDIWKGVSDHWSQRSSQAGYRLTSMSLQSEHPNIKRGEVNVGDAAKMIQKRAQGIIKEKFGVKELTVENRTPESDKFLTDLVATEMRDALINGKGGEYWYDDTMKRAMDVAAKIYPGMDKDPRQKFMYTVALAITSQGEIVSRSADLADQAYTGYLETEAKKPGSGRFPTDINAADPNISNNLIKVNKMIDQIGIDKTIKFFNEEMTARDLEKRTGVILGGKGVEPGATNKDDKVLGSAYLGPKIGNGFYQNLNGNFNPITMDLWLMRSWGRLTGTGVNENMTGQLERMDRAINHSGHPPPESVEDTIKIARDVNARHEKAYKKWQETKKPGEKYKKSEMVHAAERLTLYADGKLNEQPASGAQRNWITEIMHGAIDKLNKEDGYKLTPAGAQATWWWPEKDLWEQMGVAPKERDSDYEKSLINLAKKKGIKL